MDQRGLYSRQLGINTTIPELCTLKSYPVCYGTTAVQGRRASYKSCKRSVGLMFLRYEAI